MLKQKEENMVRETIILQKVNKAHREAFRERFPGQIEHCMRLTAERLQAVLTKKPSDMIAVDALYSPVRRVRFKVEDTRVGQITDLDKLSITVDTDGSITPKDAFEEASAILINQFTALAGATRVEAGAPLTAQNVQEELGYSDDDSSKLMIPIEDLNLSARTTNALINNDIHTLKDLFSLGDTELKELKGFGNKALDEVKDKMAELEL